LWNDPLFIRKPSFLSLSPDLKLPAAPRSSLFRIVYVYDRKRWDYLVLSQPFPLPSELSAHYGWNLLRCSPQTDFGTRSSPGPGLVRSRPWPWPWLHTPDPVDFPLPVNIAMLYRARFASSSCHLLKRGFGSRTEGTSWCILVLGSHVMLCAVVPPAPLFEGWWVCRVCFYIRGTSFFFSSVRCQQSALWKCSDHHYLPGFIPDFPTFASYCRSPGAVFHQFPLLSSFACSIYVCNYNTLPPIHPPSTDLHNPITFPCLYYSSLHFGLVCTLIYFCVSSPHVCINTTVFSLSYYLFHSFSSTIVKNERKNLIVVTRILDVFCNG